MYSSSNISISYEKTCRICLENNGFIDIFNGKNNRNENFLPPIDLINKLISSLRLEVHVDDGLPKKICLNCYRSVHTFDDFLNTVQASHDILKKNCFINQDDSDLIIEKLEDDYKISNEDESNSLNDNQNSMSSYIIETDPDNSFVISNAETGDVKFFDLAGTEHLGLKDDPVQKKSKELSCEICGSTFESESSLSQHIVNSICQKEDMKTGKEHDDNIYSKNNLNNSQPNTGFNQKLCSDVKYNIEDAMEKFDNFVDVDDGNLTEVQLYECGLCAEDFHQLNDLDFHLAIKHPESCGSSKLKSNRNIRYICEICKECFKSNYRLWRHRKSKHEVKDRLSSVIEKYKCPFCPRTFTLLETLKQHSSLHSKLPLEESKHVCLECNISFKRSDHLKMHHNGFHLKNFSFHCEYESCTKSFITNWARNKHYKKSHSSSVNVFKCNICPRVYKSSSALRRHEKTHREQPGIECNICKNYFARSDILREHLKSHNIDEKKKQELIVETYDLIAKLQNKNKS